MNATITTPRPKLGQRVCRGVHTDDYGFISSIKTDAVYVQFRAGDKYDLRPVRYERHLLREAHTVENLDGSGLLELR